MNSIKQYDLCYPIVRKYLELNDEYQEVYLLTHKPIKHFDHQHLNITFKGKKNIPYLVSVSTIKKTYHYQTDKPNLDGFGAFIPGEIYKIKVTQENKIIFSKTIKTLNQPVRFINVKHLDNVRDIGGWKTIDGNQVKYGLFYRGSKLSDIKGGFRVDKESLRVLNEYLGIKTEIDLRWPGGDDDNQKTTPLNANYFKIKFCAYNSILPNSKVPEALYFKDTAKSLRKIFRILADKTNYPIYLHCIGGADRTGTVSFLLLGLLGVPLNDLIKEYELTSFFYKAKRHRGVIKDNKVVVDNITFAFKGANDVIGFNYFVSKFIEDYGVKNAPFSKSVINYLVKHCKINLSTINRVKNILLLNEKRL
ncbi:MAG: tyrosine-protein phosphatase [Bacilli bacterium]|nr:tyrosine-protein phosphatase [Bacilli bacterium]